MLIYVYLFSLIVGGILLGASILLGGHSDADADAGLDHDLDLDHGGDLDLDADLDVDADLDADADADADGGGDHEVGGHGDLSGFLFTFVSLRFWTFFLAFFGLTGIVLDGLDLVSNRWLGLALALGMGLGVGQTAVRLIRRLTRDTTGKVAGVNDYIGKTARVLVPIQKGSVGKVRIELRGNQVDLLATGLEADDIAGKEEVLIVEMDGAKARVARLDTKKARG